MPPRTTTQNETKLVTFEIDMGGTTVATPNMVEIWKIAIGISVDNIKRQIYRNVVRWKEKWIEYCAYTQLSNSRLTYSSVWAMSMPHYTIIPHLFFLHWIVHYYAWWYKVDSTTGVKIATEKPEFQHKKCHSIKWNIIKCLYVFFSLSPKIAVCLLFLK